MTLPQLLPLTPSNALDKHDTAQRRRRLHHLTRAAVHKASKLHMEPKRLVHIVDMQSCGSSKGFGLSKSFSAVMRKSSLPLPSQSTSRCWFFSKESCERQTVAARIHTSLLEWKVDSSLDWQARVASAVPVLEEVFYLLAKSKEDYTNPQLLESQLIYVLCHFEAGNGPFLLQGSSPPYSVRTFSLAWMASLRHPDSLSHGLSSTNEDIFEPDSEVAYERAKPSLGRSSVIFSSNVQEEVRCHSDHNEGMHPSQLNHAVNEVAQKVGNMLSNKRNDSTVRSNHKHETMTARLESVRNSPKEGQGRINPCSGSGDAYHPFQRDERTTLGGMLQLDLSEEYPVSLEVKIDAEMSMALGTRDQPATNSEASLLSLNTSPSSSHASTETFCMLNDSINVKDPASQTLENVASSACSITNTSGSDNKHDEDDAVVIAGPMLQCGKNNVTFPNHNRTGDCEQRSIHPLQSALSSSLRPTGSLLSSSSSKTPSYSTTASLPSSHFSSTECLQILPSAMPSTFATSSSLLPHQLGAQHQTECQPHQPMSSKELGVISTKHDHFQRQINRETSLQSNVDNEREGLERSATFATSQYAQVGSTSSFSLLPSTSKGVASCLKEQGLKLPLRRFLAEKEECKTNVCADKVYIWESWEEATEHLDGTCCVCMVGLKGAAFVPCGHTFCRRCSRELWKGRGTCPLCNRYIREILDIY